MWVTPGAIGHLRLVDDQTKYQIIGGKPPVSLCGSGILDALAQLCLAGVVSHGRRMDQDPPVRGAGEKGEFVLVSEYERSDGQPAITLTQKNVHELQLAKGAMRTGINVLLETNGLFVDDIGQMIIAGALGTYISVASAIAIAILPQLPLDRFRQVGNTSGMEAKQALISRSKRAGAQSIASHVVYIRLATLPQFAGIFAQALYLE